MFHQCLTERKEPGTIPACTSRQETPSIGMSHNLVQGLDGFCAKPALLLAPISCPKKSTCPLHQASRPSSRLLRGNMLRHFCLRLIAFSHYGEARMHQRREQEHPRERNTCPLPSTEGICCVIKSARGGMESQALGAGLAHVPKHTHRGCQTFQEGLFGLGARGRTGSTCVHDTATMMLGGRGRMILHIRRVTCRALASYKFHVIDLLSGLMRSMTYGRANLICPGIPIT